MPRELYLIIIEILIIILVLAQSVIDFYYNYTQKLQRHKAKVDLYSVFIVVPHTQGAQAWITQFAGFTCKLHHACLYIVSVHQMAPSQTEVADI